MGWWITRKWTRKLPALLRRFPWKKLQSNWTNWELERCWKSKVFSITNLISKNRKSSLELGIWVWNADDGGLFYIYLKDLSVNWVLWSGKNNKNAILNPKDYQHSIIYNIYLFLKIYRTKSSTHSKTSSRLLRDNKLKWRNILSNAQ